MDSYLRKTQVPGAWRLFEYMAPVTAAPLKSGSVKRFVEEGIVQFYDSDGNLLRTANLLKKMELPSLPVPYLAQEEELIADSVFDMIQQRGP